MARCCVNKKDKIFELSPFKNTVCLCRISSFWISSFLTCKTYKRLYLQTKMLSINNDGFLSNGNLNMKKVILQRTSMIDLWPKNSFFVKVHQTLISCEIMIVTDETIVENDLRINILTLDISFSNKWTF